MAKIGYARVSTRSQNDDSPRYYSPGLLHKSFLILRPYLL